MAANLRISRQCRRVGCVGAGAALVTLFVAACTPAGGPAQESNDLSIATGGTGGVYYPLGGGIATEIRQNVNGYNATVQETGGSVENMQLVQAGEADLGLGVSDAVAQGVEGTGQFNEPLDLCAIGSVYDSYVHAVTTKDTDISSVQDMKDKVISIGDVGSAAEVEARRIFELIGVSPESDIEQRLLDVDALVAALRDGTVDGGFWNGGLPTGAFVDLASTGKMELIETGQFTDELKTKYGPVYFREDIPTGTYEGQTEPISTVATPNVLFASTSMDKNVQRKITATIFESKQDLIQVHPSAKELDASTAGNIPFIETCPGAQAYYDSVGE